MSISMSFMLKLNQTCIKDDKLLGSYKIYHNEPNTKSSSSRHKRTKGTTS